MIYTIDNVSELVKRLKPDEAEIPEYKKHYFDKIKTELQVHTEGKLFSKVVEVFKNEDPESREFVLETYEAVTKGSIWRGIDNISRIFSHTGFDVHGDERTLESLKQSNFFNEYVDDFINISTAKDPNSLMVWKLEEDGKTWEAEFIETQFISILNKDEIAFVDLGSSDYEIKVDNRWLNTIPFESHLNQSIKVKKSYFEGTRYFFGDNVKFIYISKFQYIEIFKKAKESQAEVTIKNFDIPLKSPYSYTGTHEIAEGVFESPMAPFIPFGNHALIQHRAYRAVETLFSYPRMSEVELPCDNCHQGMESCDPCLEFPEGVKTCTKCSGSGQLSMQSAFKIYKRKLYPDVPELNANVPPVQFFTPDIGILNYNKDAWKNTLQIGEDAIYIQQRVETGNVESAKSREKQLESMYSWLGRISSVVFSNIQDAVENYCLLTGTNPIEINKPISFAIMSELEAFEYLNQIVSTQAPIFIKTTHIENFLNRYISKTSPVIQIVQILKKVDPFVFYPTSDLQTYSDSGIINDQDWKVHVYAFPLLMQLYSQDPKLLNADESVIVRKLNEAIASKIVRDPLTLPFINPNA
jgi:hypothetical protein